MNTFLQLWDTTTGNLVTEFDSEDEAIDALRSVLAEDGDESLQTFALICFQHDRPTWVVKDGALATFIARARAREDVQVVVNSPSQMTTTIDCYGVEIQGARVQHEGSRWAFNWMDLPPRAMSFGGNSVTATSRLEEGERVAA